MVIESWRKMESDPLACGYSIVEVSPPTPDKRSMSKCRELCGQNLCGAFDNNWGCPPGIGTEDVCLGIIGRYSKAAVIKKRFSDLDFTDKPHIDELAKDHQELCRRFGNLLRREGYDTLTLADGGCSYCAKCSYPDSPCRFPDQRVTSVSSYGILMEDYLKSQNIDFSFEDDSMTLYGIILYNPLAGK